jgi:hypothetical protein
VTASAGATSTRRRPDVTVFTTHGVYAGPMEMTRSLDDLRAEARANTETATLRSRLIASLRRLDMELARWRSWDLDQEHPDDERIGVTSPKVDRETLTELRAAVLRHLRAVSAMGW